MKLGRALLFSIPLLSLALTHASDVAACGGCFVPPQESTQVTGHRMLFSLSQSETTLWDQISYSGNPASFAWVLPIKGPVEVGLSSDALFAYVESQTAVNVYQPVINCPPPPACWQNQNNGEGDSAASSGAGGAGAPGGGVNILSQAVVGPYETVQLQSSDPTALTDWLTMHGYDIPADIAPVIGAYVGEGFDFLALKLVPGQGVSAMQPVRVTTPGAGASLPLRMIAAGTGATTAITLWVFGEGRYETWNFPTFTIDPKQVVWNWDTSSSNYADLQQLGFFKTSGQGWLVESAQPTAPTQIGGPLENVAQNNPTASGYADAMGNGAVAACDADLGKLYGLLNPASMWVTRLHAELPHASLNTDLTIGADVSQTVVSNQIECTNSEGTPPACPMYPPCPASGTTTGVGGSGGAGGSGGMTTTATGVGGASMTTGSGAGAPAPTTTTDSRGCSAGSSSETPASAAMGAVGIALAIAGLRRRRTRG